MAASNRTPMVEVPFGGLAVREEDNRIPFDRAIAAADCILDYGGLRGRNGYRNALTSSAAIVGSGTAQCLARFRPSLTSAKAVAVVAGSVYKVADPSSETAIDGAATLIGSAFGASANISAAQLGRYLYLGTDEANVAMRRLDSSYALNTLETITQGTKPSAGAFSALSFTKFKDLAAPTVSGCVVQTNANTGMSGLNSDWRAFTKTNNGNDDPLTGATAEYKLAANFDATAYDWLVIGVTPRDTNSPNGQVDVYAAIDSGGSPSTYLLLGSTYDVPPVGGSPNLLFCDLRQFDPTVRAAVRWIKFLVSGSSGGKFGVYGYCFLPSKPLAPTQKYYVDFYNPATGQRSPLTEGLEVTIADSSKLNGGNIIYPNCYLTSGNFRTDESTGIMDQGNRRVFNREAGKGGMPTLADVGALVTISGTATTLTAGPSWLARLIKDTDNGQRVVTTASVASGGAYSLTDAGGLSVLANEKYKAGGAPPRCSALAARAGRLVAAYENRICISSYVAPAESSDPFPQFPAIALEEADGWAFDIAPATSEIVRQLVNGDALYILTNENVFQMSDLRPNSLPSLVFPRGALGRRAAIYVDGSSDGGPMGGGALFWAAWDGVYMAANRSQTTELTAGIRRFYTDTFAPDSTVRIAFQNRKLLVFCGTRYLRYDFVTETWTSGTIAHSVVDAAMWLDPDGSTQQLWLLTSGRLLERWQASATDDDGTAIPDWHFSTGFAKSGVKTRVRSVLVDASGPGTLLVAKSASQTETDNGKRIEFDRGQDADEQHLRLQSADLSAWKWRVDVTAKNTTILRSLRWEHEATSQQGA